NELDCWLRHEPIQARPITTVERARKWVRRRPAVAALSAGLALAFFAGVTGITWQWLRAQREWQRAERQRDTAQRQRDAAEQNLYVANMNLIEPAWQQSNARRVRELLGEAATFPG